MEELYLVLDESGFLHTNTRERYFIIGGYLTSNQKEINRKYKNAINNIKERSNISLKEELKASDLKHKEKRYVLKKMNTSKEASYVFFIIDKKHVCHDKKIKINLFYNYSVMLLIKNLYSSGRIDKSIKKLHVLLDNRSIKVGDLNGLASYCNTKFHIEGIINCNFTTYCSYIDSHNHSGIQAADLLCNVMWGRYNYPETDRSSNTLMEYITFISEFPYAKFGN